MLHLSNESALCTEQLFTGDLKVYYSESATLGEKKNFCHWSSV